MIFILLFLLVPAVANAGIIPPKLTDKFEIVSLGRGYLPYSHTVSNEHWGIHLHWVYLNDRDGGDVLITQVSKDGKKWETIGQALPPNCKGCTVRLTRKRCQFRIVAESKSGEQAPSNVLVPKLNPKLFL